MYLKEQDERNNKGISSVQEEQIDDRRALKKLVPKLTLNALGALPPK